MSGRAIDQALEHSQEQCPTVLWSCFPKIFLKIYLLTENSRKRKNSNNVCFIGQSPLGATGLSPAEDHLGKRTSFPVVPSEDLIRGRGAWGLFPVPPVPYELMVDPEGVKCLSVQAVPQHQYFLKFFIYLFLEREEREGEREEEKHPLAASCCTHPTQAPNTQPRHVPWLGIEPATFHLAGWHPTN